ncbi:MAG TPA: TolC family protein, partial [Chitinophagaceae bacterium]|nr:TolC family protein [Chitinophagaceae bacterium]
MKLRGLVWVLLLGGIGRLNAQAPLTLEEACDKALSNYPAIQKLDLLKQTEAISIENISKGFLPQLSISGQASYQSDVTQIKIPVPGISIPSLSKDQYRLLADLNQLIYDGGASKARKQLQSGIRDVSEKQVATELYQLKERINQIYLGILYTDAQLKQLQLLFKDIDTGIQRVQAQVNNGVAFRSNLDL